MPSTLIRRALPLCAAALLGTAPFVAAAKPLVYCADASPEGFDPGLWDSASTNNVNNQMFQGLLAFERGGTALVPLLAERWSVSPDAKVFTFHLRKGVRFHKTPGFTPTREFNADDVLFTFGRFIHPDDPFNKAFPAQFVYPQNLGLQQAIASIDKLDAMTVRFTLKQPNVTFLTYFAMAFAGILPAEYGAQLLKAGQASSINTQPVGTGPYRFASYRKDDAVRLEANPDYWGNKQKTDKLVFTIVRDPTVRIQKLLAKECHVAAAARDVDLAALEKRPDITIMKTQALNISYLSFNMQRKPTSVREVREALDIAIDRDAIFKALFPRGDAMQAVNPFPPIVPGYNKALKNEHDPARAKKLLAQAGYPNGFEISLWALPVVRPTNPNGALMAQMIQQDWAKIGVKATIKTYEWGEYLKRAAQGEHDVYMSGWTGDSGDPDDFLSPNLTCASSNHGVKFCNAEFDKLVAEGRATADPAKRAKVYEQALALFKRERPWITMAHSTIYIPMLKDVQGFVMQPNGGVRFENVWR
jgi:peptide/nickel transport system substrate-binding protein/dipeptide transport system substrate-binding protein